MRTFAEINADAKKAFEQSDRTALQTLIVELDALQTDEATALADNARGQVHNLRGEFNEALEYFQRAADRYEQIGDHRLAMLVKANAVNVYRRMGDYERSIEILESVVDLAEREGHRSTMAVMLGNLGVLYGEMGDISRSLTHYQRAIAIHEELGDLVRIAPLFGNLGILYRELGDFPRALQYLHRALAMCKQQGIENTASILTSVANVYSNAGDYAAAISYGQQCLEISQKLGDRLNEAVAYGVIGNAYRKQGQLEEALRYYEQSLEINRTIGVQAGTMVSMINIVNVLIPQGRIDEATEFLDQLADMPMQHLERRSWYHRLRAGVAEHHGDLETAQAELSEALSIVQAGGLKGIEPELHQELRDLARTRGDFEAYVLHNDAFLQITEEVRGREATQRMNALEAEREMEAERQERDKERALLYGALPESVATRMLRGETVDDHFDNAAVLFADVVGFTTHTSSMQPRDVITFLEEIYKTFDAICKERGVMKVKTIGDSYLAFAGAQPAESTEQRAQSAAERVAKTALMMITHEFTWPDGSPLQLRIGIHSGPVSAGVIGTERLQYDIWGDTVNVASRMESTGEAGRIQVSSEFHEQLSSRAGSLARARDDKSSSVSLGDDVVIPSASEEPQSPLPIPYSLRERGAVEIKGKGQMQTYWLEEDVAQK